MDRRRPVAGGAVPLEDGALMPVWELRRATNQFKTLRLADDASGRGAGPQDFAALFHDDKPLSATWTPPPVVYLEKNKPAGDFPYFWGANCPVFTPRSRDALRDLIAPFGEFLPLRSKDGEFAAFKVLHFSDALNLERSDIKWRAQTRRELGQPKLVDKIVRFVFDETKLQEEVIFRLPQLPLGQVFVTDVFFNKVRKSGLKGFSFHQVWPYVEPPRGAYGLGLGRNPLDPRTR